MQPKTTKRRLVPGSIHPKNPKRRITNHVYFLRCHGFIKIGTATCARSRHKAIQTVSPFAVELLCAIPGNAERERSLHRKFAHLHERGEWFRSDPALEAYVAAALDKTRAQNLGTWMEAVKCEKCGHDTRCKIARAEVERAVIPLQIHRDPSCLRCALNEAHIYQARGLEMYYASLEPQE